MNSSYYVWINNSPILALIFLSNLYPLHVSSCKLYFCPWILFLLVTTNEPIDSKRLKFTSTRHFLLKLDVRGSDSHKHSHFTELGKSRQWIKVLVPGETTTLSSQMVARQSLNWCTQKMQLVSQMVGTAISELMHPEDATCDFVSRSPGRHDLLLPCVRSPRLPYLPGLEQLLLSNLQPIRVLRTVNLHPVKCNKLTECPLEFVTSSQDLVRCSLWQH